MVDVDFDMSKTLHSIDVSSARKDVKAPRYMTRDLEWLYGMWLARGGSNPRGIYFSIPKDSSHIVNNVTNVALYSFNLHVKLVDHSVNKYRIYFNSRAIKQWWSDLEIDPNQNTAVGIIDISSWNKGRHLVITCRPEKLVLMLPYLETFHDNIVVKRRKNKSSCDVYLIDYHEIND